MSDAQKTLTIVRDKFLRMAGVAVTKVTEKLDEQTINARVLAPVCALDIAYGMFQELDPNYFKHNSKKWYNEVRMKFKAIFGTQGILYRSLTDDETMTLNDYMEKITDECKHDTDILWWQLQSHLMDFPQPDREIATKLVFIITDGDTGDPDRVGELIRGAREEGTVVIGIGIGTSEESLRKCFGHCKSFDTSSLSKLPDYVSDEIRDAMSSPNFQGY